jgi:RND superfamily putative drug exporter
VKTNVAGRAGRWSAMHPWRAIGIWLLFVAVAFAAGRTVSTNKLADNEVGSGPALKAQHVISANFERMAEETVLVRSLAYRFGDPAFDDVVRETALRLQNTGDTVNLQSPLDPGGEVLVSQNRHAALIRFKVDGAYDAAAKKAPALLAAVSAANRLNTQVRVEEAGDATISRAIEDTTLKDFRRAEMLSFPITLLVLLFAFGALVAAILPVALAATAIVAASGLLVLVSQLSPVHSTASSIMLMIGLAVGVDYSLFYIKREREERARGAGPEAALLAAAATSGRSVLVSGLTVLVAMSGMLFAGSNIFTGFAEGTMLVVATSIVGSITVLPAMLSLLGDRIERGRIPFLSRVRRPEQESRVWGAVLDRTLRRPAISAVVAIGVLLALAFPALGMKIATPDARDMPQHLSVIQTYNRILEAFPGGPAPAIVVVQAADVGTADVQAGIKALTDKALATKQMFEPVQVQTAISSKVALVSFGLAGAGQDDVSKDALTTLRDKVIPSTIGKVKGVTVLVTGMTAGTVDFNHTMTQRFPLVLGFVLIVAFLLLLVSFRSVVIAGVAIFVNMLSVAAAYGVIVGVFQNTWAEGLLDFKSTGYIASWLPLFLFVVLFGLSMDYHVFILSRIREGYDRGLETRTAVSRGIKTTAGVVTAAAVVMVFVFLTFLTLSMNSMKETGLGLATAVFLDATLVRAVLGPALMMLLGRANWYLPKWLEWLPPVTFGESATVPAQRTGEPAEIDLREPVHHS